MNADLQRAAALARANAARAVRTRLRAKMRDGSLALQLVVKGQAAADLQAQAERTDVVRLLLWAPGIGRSVAHRIIAAAEVAPSSKLDELDDAARRRLVVAADTLTPVRASA